MDDILVKPGPCNIPIIDWKSFSNEQFLKEFAYQQPFVLRDGRDNTVSPKSQTKGHRTEK